MFWGDDNAGTTTTTRYLSPGFAEQGTAGTTDIYRIRTPRAGVFKNLYVMHNAVSSSTNTHTYTLLVNGVASALTVTVAGNVSTGQDTTNTVSVVAGDQISIRITKSGNVNPAVNQIVVSAEFST
jgi:hypothetical protein